jgi:hypothetical protein
VTSSNGLEKDELLARPAGRARRMLHDDMTVIVVFIKVGPRSVWEGKPARCGTICANASPCARLRADAQGCARKCACVCACACGRARAQDGVRTGTRREIGEADDAAQPPKKSQRASTSKAQAAESGDASE